MTKRILGALAMVATIIAVSLCGFATAEEIGRAIRALESLVGRIDVEHLLDEIFASFCIGK